MRQVSNAIDKELISIGVCPTSLDHPAAQLHQLMERTKERERETPDITRFNVRTVEEKEN